MSVLKNVQKMIAELIESGMAKNEDEALKLIQKSSKTKKAQPKVDLEPSVKDDVIKTEHLDAPPPPRPQPTMRPIYNTIDALVDNEIRRGAKNEDEAIKRLKAQGYIFGDTFVIKQEPDPNKLPALIADDYMARIRRKIESETPRKTPTRSPGERRLEWYIDREIRRGAKNEKEALERLKAQGYIFGDTFVIKHEQDQSKLPALIADDYMTRIRRQGEVDTPRPYPTRLPGAHKLEGYIDREIRLGAKNEEEALERLKNQGYIFGDNFVIKQEADPSKLPALITDDFPKDEWPRYTTIDIPEKVRGKERKYSIPAIVAGITGIGALGAGAKYVYDKTKGPVRPPEDEQDSAKEAPKPQAEQPKTSKLDSLKEEIKVSPEIRETFGYNPKLENPAEYQKRVEELKESIKTIDFDIPEKEAKSFNDRRDKIAENINKIHQELKADLAEARSEKERREAAVRWGQIIETIGHALVKMSAAIHGLKTGMDLSSGLKFDKHDWNAEFDRILKDIEARRADAKAEANMKIQEQERQAAGLEKEEATARRAAERAGERQYDLAAQRLVKAEGELADITQRNVQAINRSKEFNAEQARRNYELSRELDSKLNIKKLEQAAKQAAAEGKPDRQYEQKLKLYGDMQGALASLIEKDKPEARKQFTDAAVQLGMPLEEVDTIIQKATGWSIPIIGRGDKEGAKRLAEAYKPQNTRQSPSYQLQSGLVRVTNGKEILEIPEEDVPAAEADGYRRM